MAATPKTMQQSTLSFGLGLTGVAPPLPWAQESSSDDDDGGGEGGEGGEGRAE